MPLFDNVLPDTENINTIFIGIAEYKVARAPARLETHSLGSCVGVALYDKNSKIAGLAHIMLPAGKLKMKDPQHSHKYADIAINDMLKEMIEMGANKQNIIAKIAGGACMFQGAGISECMQIGYKNITSVKQILSELNIKIISEDTGGTAGRTVILDAETGRFIIKTAFSPPKEI